MSETPPPMPNQRTPEENVKAMKNLGKFGCLGVVVIFFLILLLGAILNSNDSKIKKEVTIERMDIIRNSPEWSIRRKFYETLKKDLYGVKILSVVKCSNEEIIFNLHFPLKEGVNCDKFPDSLNLAVEHIASLLDSPKSITVNGYYQLFDDLKVPGSVKKMEFVVKLQKFGFSTYDWNLKKAVHTSTINSEYLNPDSVQ